MTTRLRWGAVALAVAVWAGQAVAQGGRGDSTALSLPEVLARAARASTPVLVGEDSLRVSGASVLEAWGRYLPALGAGTVLQRSAGTTLLSSTSQDPTDLGVHTATLQLSTALNLFNGFRDQAALRAAMHERDAAGLSLERARQVVAFDAMQAFLQVVLDRRLAEAARANLQLSTSRQSQFEDEVRIGTRAPPDLYRQRAQTAADESAVIDADARTAADLLGLIRRLRLEPSVAWTVIEPPLDTLAWSSDSLDLAALIARARHDRADLAAATARSAEASEGIRIANSLYLPRVTLGGDYLLFARGYEWASQKGTSVLTGTARSLDSQLAHQGLGVITLGVSVPLFDRNESNASVERARAAEHRAQLAAEDLRLRIEADVHEARDEYVAAVARSRATAAGLEAAQQAYDAVTGRFDVGFATFIDVLAAQSTLAQARAQRELASVSLDLRKAVLRFVTGAATLR